MSKTCSYPNCRFVDLWFSFFFLAKLLVFFFFFKPLAGTPSWCNALHDIYVYMYTLSQNDIDTHSLTASKDSQHAICTQYAVHILIHTSCYTYTRSRHATHTRSLSLTTYCLCSCTHMNVHTLTT